MKRILILILILPFFSLGAQTNSQSADRDIFFRAERRLEASDYSLALELYSNLSREYPFSSLIPDAQFRIGQCYYHLGRNQDALDQMQRVAQRYKMTRYSSYLPFWRGILAYRLGKPDDAEVELDVYIRSGNSSRDDSGKFTDVYRKEAYLYRALSLKELGRNSEASNILNELLRFLPNPSADPYLLTLLGNFYMEDGQLDEVRKMLEPVDLSLIPPPWADHLSFFKAEVLLDDGNEEEALSLYLRLTGTGSPAAGPAYERVFSIYLNRGKFDLLQGVIGRAEVDLKDEPALLNGFRLSAGIGFYRSGNNERGEFYLKKIWDETPLRDVSPLVPLYLSRIASDENQHEEGLEYLNSYLHVSNEGRERIVYTQGEFLTRLKRWGEANELWGNFFEEYPGSEFNSPASYHAGYSAYQLSLYSSALSFFENVNPVDLNGEQREGLLRMKARLLGWTGDFQGADTAWEDYLILYPRDWSSRGEALKAKFLSGDYPGTIGGALLLKRRGDTEEDRALSVLAYYLSGLSFLAEKNYDSALEDFLPLTRRQLEEAGIGDVFPFVLYYRGWTHYQSADYVRALRDFSELSLILDEESYQNIPSAGLMGRATYLAGWCAYQSGDYLIAADFFYRYSRLNEQPGQGQLMYARALAEAGLHDKAASVLEESFVTARSTPVGDDTLFELAGQLYLAGDSTKAMEKYRELFEIYPDSTLAEESLFQRGEKYLAMGEWAEAQDAFYLCRRSFPEGRLIAAAHYWGGEAARLGGEDFGAVLLWDRLIEEYPDSPFRSLAYRHVGELYMKRGDYDKARNYFDSLRNDYPEESLTLEVVTLVETLRYLMRGESEEIAQLRAEIKAYGRLESPESREAMLELARILLYRSRDDRPEAKLLLADLVFYRDEDLERAARAQYYLGEYHFMSREWREAGEAFLLAATMNPGDTDLMAMSIFRAAESAREQGSITAVRELVRRLGDTFPDSQWYAEGLELLEAE
ncbi:MAG: tetratricopeptide repeat protein [Spirochaetales bacterium]|nr:tetratricopeptide repeat protein [Spirochaetales bacterium]